MSLLLRKRWLVISHDVLWIPLAIWMAFWARFNLEMVPALYLQPLHLLIALSLPIQAVVFWYFGLYRGVWRFASVPDLLRILKGVAVGVTLSFLALFIIQRLEGIPRSVLIFYPLILVLGLAGPRLLYRWMKDRHLNLTMVEGKRALLIGAGQAGELLVRDLLKGNAYQAIGFLEDYECRQGQEIHGVRVIGHLADLEQVVAAYNVEVVLLAIPAATHQMVQSVLHRCQEIKVQCRILPSVVELADGRVEVSRLRSVQIEDLLGREPIALDIAGVQQLLTQQSVVVTGAGGSIGSELCRQILSHNPRQLVLLDHGEFNLYSIDQELRILAEKQGVALAAVLGDIRDGERISWVFETFKPALVFNAAAYKHVPLVEDNPAEGIKTNVLGTCQLADLAVQYGIKKFVQVSTDKAVNPTNVMGATKRCAEIYCQNLNSRTDKTAFITTRFGNVLGSAGSVVPLFRKQIEAGGPITVTHPDMTRYFMTIPEAVTLILQAGSMGKGGEIFVLDMGKPVKITDLAEQMIRLTGLEPGRDISLAFTGLRPGEKLFEELFHGSEVLVETQHPKIMLSGSRVVDWLVIQQVLAELREACTRRDIGLLHQHLKSLVPEFASSQLKGDQS
ncbi:MAG: nucleoside-diphosphate sugar epimerase/dehydratase [Mariprofundus sp.]|nr:nucleoside-diphosphate sugar epimerase/dehydratase [Mariprofundus sp.]